jgi:general stress protein YciG
MQINRKTIEEILRSETSLPHLEVQRLARLIGDRLKQEEKKRMKALGRAGGLRTKAKRTKLDPNYYSTIGKQGGRGHKKPREEESNG